MTYEHEYMVLMSDFTLQYIEKDVSDQIIE